LFSIFGLSLKQGSFSAHTEGFNLLIFNYVSILSKKNRAFFPSWLFYKTGMQDVPIMKNLILKL